MSLRTRVVGRFVVWMSPALTAGLILSASAQAAPGIVQVSPLAGYQYSSVVGLSSDGTMAAGSSSPQFGQSAPIRWVAGVGSSFLGGFPNQQNNNVYSISGDGSVISGAFTNSQFQARNTRWVSGSGFTDLGTANPGTNGTAIAVSRDGSTLVTNEASRSYRWTAGGGYQQLTSLGGVNGQATGIAASANGSIIVGGSGSFGSSSATLWNGTSPTDLGIAPSFTNSDARAVSADGSVVVVRCGTNFAGSDRFFRWTLGTGLVQFSGPGSWFDRISDDGNIIGGRNATGAAVWSQSFGMRDLNTYLPSIGIDLTGWFLTEVTGLSADGSVIAGNGYFNNTPLGFVVTIPAPGALAAVAGAGLWASRRRRR